MMKSVTKEKVFHVLKLVLLAVTVTLVMASVELAGRHWKISAVRALLYHKFCLDNQPVS